MRLETEQDVHVIRLDKGGEHWVFVYTRQYRIPMALRLAEWAMNPELRFTWYDAARIAQKMREWQ